MAVNVSVLSMTKVRYGVGVVTVLTRSKALRTKLIIVDCNSKWLVSNINRFGLQVKFKCQRKNISSSRPAEVLHKMHKINFIPSLLV